MCPPKFHPQYSYALSFLYIPVHNLGSYKCALVVRFLFGIGFLLKRNKMTNTSIYSPRLFLSFYRNQSLKSCIKQPQSYLKCQKIKIKVLWKILFYSVFIGKPQKLHLFKSSPPKMFCK